ncbi:MAG TPA: fasciclin domain-containing protein [Candidatus Acidoferrum sp.]|nr:fasciclin domain-containing protein [Candidatus Acidoferrum sp.]
MKRLVIGLFAGLLAAVGTGSLPVAASGGSPTIVGIASSTPAFSTLTAAVVCTGLAPALNGRRHYTVFAPTNAAFAKLGLNASNVCAALPKATLTNILLYHVTPGTRLAKNVLPRRAGQWRTIETLLDDQSFQVNSQGMIRTSSGGSSQIVTANIRASNGVIHVIDSVLIPGAANENQED